MFEYNGGWWVTKKNGIIEMAEDDEHFQYPLCHPEWFGLDEDWALNLIASFGFDEDEMDDVIYDFDEDIATEVINNAIEAGNLRIRVLDFGDDTEIMITCWNLNRDKNKILKLLLDNEETLKNYQVTFVQAQNNRIHQGGYFIEDGHVGSYKDAIEKLL